MGNKGEPGHESAGMSPLACHTQFSLPPDPQQDRTICTAYANTMQRTCCSHSGPLMCTAVPCPHAALVGSGAQAHYEADLQQAVRSLQEQYNSAIELLQLGASTGALTAAHTAGQGMDGARGKGAAMPHSPKTIGPAHGTVGKEGPAATYKHGQRAAARASADPRANLLGLRADELSPVVSYGASVGLVTEPIAVLRDVLNLNQEHGQERPKSAAAAVSGVSSGVAAGGHAAWRCHVCNACWPCTLVWQSGAAATAVHAVRRCLCRSLHAWTDTLSQHATL